jgi:hypothetical protein
VFRPVEPLLVSISFVFVSLLKIKAGTRISVGEISQA